MRWCVGGMEDLVGEVSALGRVGPFASALVEAIKVNDSLKVKDAIFWPLRLIIKFVARPSCITVKKKMVQEKQEI